jgi:hypothetical protein
MAASARERWNERRSQGGFEPFPDTPAQWLVDNGPLLGAGGRALDVACGDGRNALHLARLGFEVDAVDVSDVAIDALCAVAPERAPAVRPRVVDLFGALERALRPGGWLIFETLGRAHIDELGKRINPVYVLGDNELLHAFPGLRVRRYREGVVARACGPRGVASLVAQRPPM